MNDNEFLRQLDDTDGFFASPFSPTGRYNVQPDAPLLDNQPTCDSGQQNALDVGDIDVHEQQNLSPGQHPSTWQVIREFDEFEGFKACVSVNNQEPQKRWLTKHSLANIIMQITLHPIKKIKERLRAIIRHLDVKTFCSADDMVFFKHLKDLGAVDPGSHEGTLIHLDDALKCISKYIQEYNQEKESTTATTGTMTPIPITSTTTMVATSPTQTTTPSPSPILSLDYTTTTSSTESNDKAPMEPQGNGKRNKKKRNPLLFVNLSN